MGIGIKCLRSATNGQLHIITVSEAPMSGAFVRTCFYDYIRKTKVFWLTRLSLEDRRSEYVPFAHGASM
jgi:hypothetical protein